MITNKENINTTSNTFKYLIKVFVCSSFARYVLSYRFLTVYFHVYNILSIQEFWRFFNNLGKQSALDILPNLCNLRMFRQSIPSKSTVAERSYKTGSWDIQFTHNGTSVNDKFIKLCLLATCELLGTDVVMF